jgi:hypothetical protein
LGRGVTQKEAGQEEEKSGDKDFDPNLMETVPSAAVFEPAVVGVLGVHFCYAVVDGHEYGDGEDDRRSPEDGGSEDRPESEGIGTVLVGVTEDEREGGGVPEWHPFTQGAGERNGGLSVRFLSQPSKLRVDKGCDGKLVADHGGCDGCGCDVVSDGHRDSMHEMAGSIVK